MSAIIGQSQTSNTRSHIVNVKSHGAKINGVTNDLAAIQTAINSITTGTVIIPAGICRIEGTIRLKDGVTLEGQGSDVTILLLAGAFYTATPVHWDTVLGSGAVIKDKILNNRVAISLIGGANTHPENSQTYIKNLSIKPASSPSTEYAVTAIYGNFLKGGVENVSSAYCNTGAVLGLNTAELKGSGKFSNGTYGIKLLQSLDALIQKVDLSSNTIGMDILSYCTSVDVQSVNFSSCYAAIRAEERCNVLVSSPVLKNIVGKPFLAHPSSKITVLPEKTSTLKPINLVQDGYMEELSSTWTLSYSLGPSSETPIIKKVFENKSSDTWLSNAYDSGKRKLYIDPKDAANVIITGLSQKLGYLDWNFSARTTQKLRLQIEDISENIIYDSTWIYGNLVSGQNTGILPTRINGTLLDIDDSAGTSGPYTIKIYSSGVTPFYIDSLTMYESIFGYTSLNYDIAAENGMRIYEWGKTDSAYIELNFPTQITESKYIVSLFAKPNDGSTANILLGAGAESTNKDISSASQASLLLDNDTYQYFDFEVSAKDIIYVYKPENASLNIAGFGAYKLYDTLNGAMVLSGVPTIGWYPLGSKIIINSGIWTCTNNASFPNTFSTEISQGLNYTWSGTYLGVKNENESSYAYMDLAGPALEYAWSGTSLGVRIEGSGDDFIYANLGGISGLQGPIGATGATGATGPTGASGLVGAMGASGVAGKNLEFDWVGTTLGIRVSGVGSYEYTNLIGPSGVAGASGLAARNLEFNWVGTTLGVRVSGIGEYVYQDVAGISGIQGPVGATGAIGATGPSAIYARTSISNGYAFAKGVDGSYNITDSTLSTSFYRDSTLLNVAITTIKQLNDVLYEYLTVYAGAYTPYPTTSIIGGNSTALTVVHTHPSGIVSERLFTLVKHGASGVVGATGATGATGSRGYMGSGLLYDVAGTRIGVKTFDELVYTYTDDLRPSGVNNLEVSGTLYASAPSGIRMRSTDDLKDFWLYISNSGGSGYQLYIREI